MSHNISNDDILDALKSIKDNTYHAVLSDPPYGLKFMGKQWDHGVPSVEVWEEMLRVCKPGAHILIFGGTRTHHRLMCNIEDAGWEVVDCLMWLYGSGFPKSHSVSKAIDKKAGAKRKVVGSKVGLPGYSDKGEKDESGYDGGWKSPEKECEITASVTPEAQQFEGYGTGLKPANEPIILCRRPHEGTIVENVLKYGCGALNIDGCRVETADSFGGGLKMSSSGRTVGNFGHYDKDGFVTGNDKGRWPANIIHDGSDEVEEVFPQTSYGNKKGGYSYEGKEYDVNGFVKKCKPKSPSNYGDEGSASRFFYCAKASKKERGEGNSHPTVKPLSLCEYLAKLLVPPILEDEDRRILVPYSGSGSEMIGALNVGWDQVDGIEKEQEYCEIAEKRIKDRPKTLWSKK